MLLTRQNTEKTGGKKNLFKKGGGLRGGGGGGEALDILGPNPKNSNAAKVGFGPPRTEWVNVGIK